MIISILCWYVAISYIIGVVIFFVELPDLLKESGEMVAFGAACVLASPLVAWHGVLHYAQKAFCKLTGRPVKYWI